MKDLTQNIFTLRPTTMEEAIKFAEIIAESDLVPKEYKNKPGNVLVAIQMGAEVGLPSMQAIQNIAVINGRPSIWGDAIPAIIKAHPKYESMHESFDPQSMAATCKIKRAGEPEVCQQFSSEDAKKAGLWGKSGPWTQYPKRMLQMRARGFAARDAFPDALKGLSVAEEAQDIVDMGPVDVVSKVAPKVKEAAAELPDYPSEKFDENFNSWVESIASGKTTPGKVIAMISCKYTLSENQISAINNEEPILP